METEKRNLREKTAAGSIWLSESISCQLRKRQQLVKFVWLGLILNDRTVFPLLLTRLNSAKAYWYSSKATVGTALYLHTPSHYHVSAGHNGLGLFAFFVCPDNISSLGFCLSRWTRLVIKYSFKKKQKAEATLTCGRVQKQTMRNLDWATRRSRTQTRAVANHATVFSHFSLSGLKSHRALMSDLDVTRHDIDNDMIILLIIFSSNTARVGAALRSGHNANKDKMMNFDLILMFIQGTVNNVIPMI